MTKYEYWKAVATHNESCAAYALAAKILGKHDAAELLESAMIPNPEVDRAYKAATADMKVCYKY